MDELEGQGLTNMLERLESEFHTWLLKYVRVIIFEHYLCIEIMNLSVC
mgnify:CR=1 FL=1